MHQVSSSSTDAGQCKQVYRRTRAERSQCKSETYDRRNLLAFPATLHRAPIERGRHHGRHPRMWLCWDGAHALGDCSIPALGLSPLKVVGCPTPSTPTTLSSPSTPCAPVGIPSPFLALALALSAFLGDKTTPEGCLDGPGAPAQPTNHAQVPPPRPLASS